MKKQILIVLLCLLVSIIAVHAGSVDNAALSMSLVNQDPDPAAASDVVEVRLGVENVGGLPFNDLVVEFVPEYPFEMVSGEPAVQYVGTIKGYQTQENIKIVKFKIRVDKQATAGSYELKFDYYPNGSYAKIQKSFSIEVDNKESAEVIYIDQVELIPGKITPLKFTINNVGSAPLRQLTFQWENANDIILPVGSDNTKYIKYIEIGQSADLKFDVIASANADPDLYKLDLTLSYEDPITGIETSSSTKAGVYVGGATDFDAAFSGVSSGEYSFVISNIGSVSASSVTVKVPDQSGWRVSGSNSMIIGNLNEGDYTIASFILQRSGQASMRTGFNRNSGAGGNQVIGGAPYSTINLEIVYTDSRGNRNTLTKAVPVDNSAIHPGVAGADSFASMRKPRQSPLLGFWNSSKWILLGFVIVVLLLLIRKKQKIGKQQNAAYGFFSAAVDTLVFRNPKKKQK